MQCWNGRVGSWSLRRNIAILFLLSGLSAGKVLGASPDVLWTQSGADVTATALSSEGRFALTVENKETVLHLWRVSDQRTIHRLDFTSQRPTDGSVAISLPEFSPDGHYFAAKVLFSSPDPAMRRSILNIWRTEDGSLYRSLEAPGFSMSYNSQCRFTRDGRHVFEYGNRHQALWRLEDGRLLSRRMFSEGLQELFSDITPDGSLIALTYCSTTGIDDRHCIRNGIRIRSTMDWSIKRDIDQPGAFSSPLKFTPDGRTLLQIHLGDTDPVRLTSQWVNRFRVWENGGDLPRTVLEGTQEGMRYRGGVAFSPDGEWVARPDCLEWNEQFRGCTEGAAAVRIWRTEDGKEFAPVRLPEKFVSFRFSPDEKALIIHGGNGTYICELPTGAFLARVPMGLLSPKAFSKDGKYLAAWTRSNLYLLDGRNGDLLRSIPPPDSDEDDIPYKSLSLSPDGTLIAVAYGRDVYNTFHLPSQGIYGPSIVNHVELRKISDGSNLAFPEFDGIYPDFAGKPNALDFSPDGTLLAVAFGTSIERRMDSLGLSSHWWGRNEVVIYRVSDGQRLRQFSPSLELEEQSAVAFSPDGSLLAGGGKDGIVRVWRLKDGSLASSLSAPHSTSVKRIRFSPDGTSLSVSHADGALRLWSFEGSAQPQMLRGWGMAPPGWSAYVIHTDDRLEFRSLDGQILHAYDEGVTQLRNLVFTEDGRRYAFSRDNGEMVVAASPLVPSGRKGDVNQDGSSDIADAVLCLRMIVGLFDASESQWWEADLDGNGTVTVTDVVLLLKRILESPPQE